MPPRNRTTAPAAFSPSANQPTYSNPSASGAPVRRPSSTASNVKNAQDVQEIVQGIWQGYVDKTPQRVKLIDAFMAFLVLVGGLQFVYCVVAGNYVSASTELRRDGVLMMLYSRSMRFCRVSVPRWDSLCLRQV